MSNVSRHDLRLSYQNYIAGLILRVVVVVVVTVVDGTGAGWAGDRRAIVDNVGVVVDTERRSGHRGR